MSRAFPAAAQISASAPLPPSVKLMMEHLGVAAQPPMHPSEVFDAARQRGVTQTAALEEHLVRVLSGEAPDALFRNPLLPVFSLDSARVEAMFAETVRHVLAEASLYKKEEEKLRTRLLAALQQCRTEQNVYPWRLLGEFAELTLKGLAPTPTVLGLGMPKQIGMMQVLSAHDNEAWLAAVGRCLERLSEAFPEPWSEAVLEAGARLARPDHALIDAVVGTEGLGARTKVLFARAVEGSDRITQVVLDATPPPKTFAKRRAPGT